MPHIPPEVIEEIKQVANIVDIISEYLPLKKETDGKKDYSGFLIHLSFNRRAK